MEIASTNHQDVAEPDLIASGVAGTGQENEKKASASKKPIATSRSRKVERKTELQFAAASFMDPSEIRKRTERDLKFPDTDIPYYKAEVALRDLVCSFMEREDRMNEEMFLRWNGLRHRIEDLEDEVQALKSRGITKDQEVPE
jgi:hypothetical protein